MLEELKKESTNTRFLRCKYFSLWCYIKNYIESHFVIAKERVAPLKRLSVLKIELTAACIASRFVKYVLSAYLNELQIEKIFI